MDSGHLYIVSTPIGNMQDITLRAIDTLKSVDVVVCEDTRVTGKLLHHLKIKKSMVSLNEFNETTVIYELISQLSEGVSMALVSDGGTPLISDPGFQFVRAAKRKNIKVTPIPGPSAVITALTASGLPTDSFLFLGFLPKNKTKKSKLFTHIHSTINKDYSPTLVMYESPHRIAESLKIIQSEFGDIMVVVAREMTKMYEEYVCDKVSKLSELYHGKTPKGEITLVFSLKQ